MSMTKGGIELCELGGDRLGLEPGPDVFRHVLQVPPNAAPAPRIVTKRIVGSGIGNVPGSVETESYTR